MMKNILIKSILLGSLILSLNADFIRDNTKQVVNDTKTGLLWQDDAFGSPMDWSTAITTCENLTLGGYSDWRLPNIKELKSIVDKSRTKPALSPNFITFTFGSYLSATTSADDTNTVWVVGSLSGDVYLIGSKMDSYYVRCVRGGQ